MKHKRVIFIALLAALAVWLVTYVGQTGSETFSDGESKSLRGSGVVGERDEGSPRSYFPVGVFEDANMVRGDPTRFERMIEDLKSRGFDYVMLSNASVDRDVALLDVSDRLDFNVIFSPANDLERLWWSDKVPLDEEIARIVIEPIVKQLKSHPSLKGYFIIDEPTLDLKDKVVMATKIFQENDQTRPVLSNLVGIDRVGLIFAATRPNVMLINAYPIGARNPIGDFRMTGFGYDFLDIVSYVRILKLVKPTNTPLWTILQTHKFKKPSEPAALREPLPAEVRAQNWLAIGEGSKGIFWFVYSSQQGWRGLADNPMLYDEVTRLAQRVKVLRDVLVNLQKVGDRFTIKGDKNPYISTMANNDGTRRYVVAVNRDCEQPQMLSIDSFGLKGWLWDLESSRIYPLNKPIEFLPCDGKLLEFIGESASSVSKTTRSMDDGKVNMTGGRAPGVPEYSVDPSKSVEEWWAQHPYNPESPSYDPRPIVSPEPVINVADVHAAYPDSKTAGIEEALEMLPIDGGSLWLPKSHGPYVIIKPATEVRNVYLHSAQINVLRRSNIHFLSDGATIRQGIDLGFGHSTFSFSTMEFNDYGTVDKPLRNFYFKDIVFDGSNGAATALAFEGVRDVLFDNVVFQGYRSYQKSHPGVVSTINKSDNMWFRNSRFLSGHWGVYMDGTHGSGIINSRFDKDLSHGGVLLLTNDDIERRKPAYVIIANNTFAGTNPNATVVQMAATDTLIANNRVDGEYGLLVGSDGKISKFGVTYEYSGNRIVGNTLQGVRTILRITGNLAYNIRDFEVRNNSASGLIKMLELDPGSGSIDDILIRENRLTGSDMPYVRVSPGGDVRNVKIVGNDIIRREGSLLRDDSQGMFDPANIVFEDNRLHLP